MLAGFDVSKWQGGAYSGGGSYSFGIAKASEGTRYRDSAYERHIAAIRASGVIPGAYHFAREDLNPNNPEHEADWFLVVVGDPRGMLLVLDLEVGSGALAWWRDRFCERVHARCGQPCWWYSYHSFVGTHALNTSGTPYPFWLAWPNAGPMPTYAFGAARMQQYGLTSVPGIGGSVDANRFFGSLGELRALAIGGGGTLGIGQYSSDGDLVAFHHLIQRTVFGVVDPSPDSQQGFVNAVRGGVPLNAIWDGWAALDQAQQYAGSLARLVATTGEVDHLSALTPGGGVDPARLQAALQKLAADRQAVLDALAVELADLKADAADPAL